MKILSLHCDYIKFKPVKKAIKEPEKITKEDEKGREVRECIVILTSIEKSDEQNPSAVIKSLIENIKHISSQVRCKKIVLYPYAHLATELASPHEAMKILQDAEQELKKQKFDVVRAPFGYYKQFELKCKGHPLAELSRVISAESKKEEKSVAKARKKGSEFCKFILVDKQGKEYEITEKNWCESKIWQNKESEYQHMKIFVRNELEGAKEKEMPKHIIFMKKLELVDYCPESDIGHHKWYPKGMLIRKLILDFQEKLALEYGAFRIQNPLIYRLSVPAINQLLGEFHEKDYSWQEGNEKLILRFASDPGAFPFMQKINFSHKDMPVKEYEEAICFRKEQKGEVKGLRRVRNFMMTDLHAFCKDMQQLREEYVKLCLICKQLMDGIIAKGRWVLGWEGTFEFYEKNREWLLGIVKKLEVPSFFKLMKEKSHYYDIKNEFQSVESDEATTQISTVQIDTTNGERFNICYVDEHSRKKPCLIIHCSTFGSIERTLCAILENAAIDEQEGKKPSFPFWLSPTQARVIPVSEKYVNEAIKLSEELNSACIRADVDDRALHVQKKILEAEQEWTPYIIVLGEKELKSKTLAVRRRADGKIYSISKEEFVNEAREKQVGMPFKPLPLPMLLSKRPKFVG